MPYSATKAAALLSAVCAQIAGALRFSRTNSQIPGVARSRPRPRWTALSVSALVALGALQGAWLRAGVDEWTNSGPGKAEITRIIADPFRPGRLVVGARGSADAWKSGSAWMTTDGGVTWSELGLPLYEDMAGAFRVEGMAFVPDEPDLMFAQVEPWAVSAGNEWSIADLCVSRDGGATWSHLGTGWSSAVASRVTPGLIYRTRGALFEASTDYGQSWQTRGTLGQHFSTSSLAVAGGQPEVIWAAGREFYLAELTGVLKSTDGGWTWESAGLANFDITLLAIAGPDGGEAPLAGDRSNLWRLSSGSQWSETGLTGIHRFAVDPMDRSTVYAVSNQRLYRSLNAGVDWETVWTASASDRIGDVAVSPGAPQTLYLSSLELGLQASSDGGQTWQSLDLGIRGWVSCVVADPLDSVALYAGADRLYTSSDGGQQWNGVVEESEPLPGILDLAITPEPAGPIYAIRQASITHVPYIPHALYKSLNGGKSWQAVLIPDGSYTDVQVAPSSPDTVYAATSYNGHDGGVYRSTNAGVDWALVAQGLPRWGADGLAVDPEDSRLVLTATVRGLFRTTNGGDAWTQVPAFSDSSVGAVAFHPRRDGVAFVSVGSRLFQSTDRGMTWSALANLKESVNHIAFDPRNDQTLYAASSVFVYLVDTDTGQFVRFTPPGDQILGFALTNTTPTTVHVATSRGVYSLTPTSGEKSDFEVKVTFPSNVRLETYETQVTYTISVTNRGPADFVGSVRLLYASPLETVSVDSPGWSSEYGSDTRPDHLHESRLVRTGLFAVGETQVITVNAQVADLLQSAPTVVAIAAPSRPVDSVSSNNAVVTLIGRGRYRTARQR